MQDSYTDAVGASTARPRACLTGCPRYIAADNVRCLWITFLQREVTSVQRKPLFPPPEKKKRMSRRPVRS